MKHYNIESYDSTVNEHKVKKNYKSSYWKNMERKEAITNEYRRTVCEKCKSQFTQTFIRTCYISNFTYGTVCKDCMKKFNLHEV